MFAAAFFCCGLAGLAAAGALGGVGTWLLSDSGQWAILGTVSAAIAWAIFGGGKAERRQVKMEDDLEVHRQTD